MHIAQILLVEDNAGDIELVKVAFEDSKLVNDLHIVESGLDAINFLLDKDKSVPDIILLDLNMPRMDGREMIEKIRNDENLSVFRKIPIVVLTSSSAHLDIDFSYSNCANAYIVKPLNFKKFIEVIHKIEDFWFAVVKLPS